MENAARKLFAAGALLAASALGITGLVAGPAGSGGAVQAASAAGVQWAAPARVAAAQPGNGNVRRESQVPTRLGPAPLTGAPSDYNPLSKLRALSDPIWGDNHKANTDPSPTLAQQEPSIAINPTNPLNVVAAAKDERGGINTKQVWIYTSTDGGVTWINQQFPLSPMSPYSSDPVVNFADDGQLYVTALPYGGGANDGIQVARSTDSGITFSPGVHLPGSSGNSDKEWTWVDNFPSSPYYHRIYDAWRNFGSGADVLLNYSSDRGATWSSTVPAVPSAYQFPQPVVLPNGNVLVTYYGYSGLAYARSTDGGATFSGENFVAPINDPNCPPDNAGCGIWRLNAIPATGVDPTTGNTVIVWADGSQGTATIYYTRSTDNGATWSARAQLAPPGVANTYQVEPWVTSDEQGTWHAVWYDDRENPNTSIFNIYYAQSTDAGATWSTATRISTATSDLRIGVPSGYARAAGDYINVTAHSGNVYAVWTDTRSGTGEDIYMVRGTYGGTTTPTPTVVPPTATSTEVPSTPTATSVPPTETPVPPTPCAITFSDVPPENTFYPYVRCLACRGILGGYDDGTFRPNNPITRGQISKIVSNAAGWTDPIPNDRQTYTDVDPNHPFWLWIERATAHGIMSGYNCGGPGEPCDPQNRPYFRPWNNATRAQLAKIDSNAAGYNEDPTTQTFTDVDSTHPFYVWIERLATRGIMGGYACGGPGEPCDPQNRPYFRPYNDVTRGQAAKIVANTFYPNCQTPSIK